MWNYALSQTEIKSTINSELTGSETGLVALWDLDDGSGTTVADSAGSPANGTITGTGYAWSAGVALRRRHHLAGHRRPWERDSRGDRAFGRSGQLHPARRPPMRTRRRRR